MLEAPGRLLPRPMSLCLAPPDEAFLLDRIGPGTRALAALRAETESNVLGPLETASTSRSSGRSSSRAASVSPMPYLSEALGGPPALLGFPTERHAEAARLLPGAEVVVEPRLVTSSFLDDPGDVLACGPEPMLEALRELAPRAQLAWEAPMACGYGACFGCVIEVEGRRPACADGPVL